MRPKFSSMKHFRPLSRLYHIISNIAKSESFFLLWHREEVDTQEMKELAGLLNSTFPDIVIEDTQTILREEKQHLVHSSALQQMTVSGFRSVFRTNDVRQRYC